MEKTVIVAGHICLDITPVFKNKNVKRIEELISPGKLVETGEADVHTGGCVANTGLALKKFGVDVSLMGKIGHDAFGDMICSILDKFDAGAYMIRDAKSSTSYSVVLALPGLDRVFLHHPGANHTFYASDISEEMLKRASLFHFGYPPLMQSMYQEDGQELLNLLQRVKANGIATSMDMAAVDAESQAGNVNWDILLQQVLPFVDFFEPSVEELCFMLDKNRFSLWQERAAGNDITEILDIEKDVKPLAKKCLSYGAGVVVVKCGVRGMYYQTAKKERMARVGEKAEIDVDAWAEKAGFEYSYIPECVCSATGAGDTAIAAFLAAMIRGETLETAMQLATAAGAACVTSYDALSGLMSIEALKQKINSGWEKRKAYEQQ